MSLFYRSFTSKLGHQYTLTSGDDYFFDQQDCSSLIEILNDPKVFTYITQDALKKYYPSGLVGDMARDFLQKMPVKWQKGEEHRFLIRNSQNKLVGVVGYDIREGNIPELWYFKLSTAPPFMSSVVPLTIEFQKKFGFAQAFATVDPTNIASIIILEKNGFKKAEENNNQGKISFKYELVF